MRRFTGIGDRPHASVPALVVAYESPGRTILAIGSVPLLEERMAQFIADGGVNPPAARRP